MKYKKYTNAPKNIDPVTDFQVGRYLGTWYEIVRQDHAFEEGLSITIDWYLNNEEWLTQVTSGAYREYYKEQYN